MPTKPDPHDVLIAELEREPISDVLGVLCASGMGGVGSGKDTSRWILQFELTSWKYFGGEIQNRELIVRKFVSDQELRSTMGQFEPYDIVRLCARVAEKNSYNKPQALLEKIVGKYIFDTDLKKRALVLQEPTTFEDERFGVFTLDHRVDCYEGNVTWGSINIRLILSPSENEDAKSCLATAYAILDLQSVWHERITNYATAEFLSLKNDSWLGEDEAELSMEEFKSRLILNSITVYANDDFEFWFDDDGLFFGHSIRIAGNLSRGPSNAGLEG
jgi:hypothetical protein